MLVWARFEVIWHREANRRGEKSSVRMSRGFFYALRRLPWLKKV
ncbi:hypothetical protein GWL_10010 [Herbaspirillum sp. GW103]|nr:hypothetical protein GWL_10010 [Herbaspirillum sp. GW103]